MTQSTEVLRPALKAHIENLTIRVVNETLTDGSVVCNVRFGDITLHAYDQKAALMLADQLFSAVDEHTVDVVHLY